MTRTASTLRPPISARQVQLLQMARRAVSLDEGRYRLLLRNVGGVESSKHLANRGFESCMAVLEDLGFAGRVNGRG